MRYLIRGIVCSFCAAILLVSALTLGSSLVTLLLYGVALLLAAIALGCLAWIVLSELKYPLRIALRGLEFLVLVATTDVRSARFQFRIHHILWTVVFVAAVFAIFRYPRDLVLFPVFLTIWVMAWVLLRFCKLPNDLEIANRSAERRWRVLVINWGGAHVALFGLFLLEYYARQQDLAAIVAVYMCALSFMSLITMSALALRQQTILRSNSIKSGLGILLFFAMWYSCLSLVITYPVGRVASSLFVTPVSP